LREWRFTLCVTKIRKKIQNWNFIPASAVKHVKAATSGIVIIYAIWLSSSFVHIHCKIKWEKLQFVTRFIAVENFLVSPKQVLFSN